MQPCWGPNSPPLAPMTWPPGQNPPKNILSSDAHPRPLYHLAAWPKPTYKYSKFRCTSLTPITWLPGQSPPKSILISDAHPRPPPLGCLRAARWLPGRSRDGGHATLHFRAVPSTIGLLGATVSADIRAGTHSKSSSARLGASRDRFKFSSPSRSL